MLSLVVMFQIINPAFLNPTNVATMLRAMVYPGIVGIGMALCMISGVIDLSVGATAGLTSVIFAEATVNYGMDFFPALAICLIAGALIGSINGVIVTKLRVTPFIMTICSMYAIRGLASWISNGYAIYPLPKEMTTIAVAQPLGLSWAFIIMVILMIIASIFLDKTVWGLTVRATGSDKESAKCTEVNTDQVHISVFIITGSLAALAGIAVSLVISSGTPTIGQGWELNAIAACAIGGISLFGYEGSFVGLFCGLLTLQIIQNGIVIIGISPYAQTIVIGVILLGSMIMEIRRRRWLNLESI